jgi:hypothetical protein
MGELQLLLLLCCAAAVGARDASCATIDAFYVVVW